MHRPGLNQAMAIVSGFGYIMVLPPNAEQAAQGVKANDYEVVGSYAFCEGDERDLASLRRFKKILKRRTSTTGSADLAQPVPTAGVRPGGTLLFCGLLRG
jgi:hypothetical protein